MWITTIHMAAMSTPSVISIVGLLLLRRQKKRPCKGALEGKARVIRPRKLRWLEKSRPWAVEPHSVCVQCHEKLRIPTRYHGHSPRICRIGWQRHTQAAVRQSPCPLGPHERWCGRSRDGRHKQSRLYLLQMVKRSNIADHLNDNNSHLRLQPWPPHSAFSLPSGEERLPARPLRRPAPHLWIQLRSPAMLCW